MNNSIDQNQFSQSISFVSHVTATSSPLTAPTSGQKLLIVDSRLPDFQKIVDSANSDVKVVVIDKYSDGLQQLLDVLSKTPDVSELAIASHGDAGVLLLGSTVLHQGNLGQFQEQLQKIGQHLTTQASIEIFGCKLGAGDTGVNFVNQLAGFLGHQVSASSNDTGDQSRGGDWELEISSGKLQQAMVFDSAKLADYDHLLATTSVNTLAALKSAIATYSTNSTDDTITLTGDITFANSSDTIIINNTDGKNITIAGGNYKIDGANKAQVLQVAAGSVTLQNITITNGFLTGNGGDAGINGADVNDVGGAGADALGAAIKNAGTLTITNSTISNNKAAGGGGAGGLVTGGAGGGGGGGGFGTTNGGNGGSSYKGSSPGNAGSAGKGGTGGTSTTAPGGGGGSTTGGAGGASGGYTTGGNGATANNGTFSIGGGGGGAGYSSKGGAGGNAVAGIFNTGTLLITKSSITGNIAAGGGGGGGGGSGYSSKAGGNGGYGVGGIKNNGGTVTIDSITNSSLATGNVGVGGSGGSANKTNGTAGTSANQTSGSITITSPPTTVVNSASLSADTGTSSSDWITSTAIQTINGVLSANLASGEKVEVSYDGGSTWSNAQAYSVGSSSWSTSTTLAGANTFQARVSNADGSSTAFSQSYTLDTTAPTTTVSTLAFSADTGSSNTDFITKTAAQTISGTLSANVASGEIVQVSLDNGSTWADATAAVGQNTYTLSGQTLTASNTLKVKVVDTAGNESTTKSQAYVLDTTAPTTTIATLALSADTGSSSSDFITKTAAQTISGTLSANVVSGEIVQVSLDNGSTWATASTTVGQNTYSLAGQTLSGSNTLKVKVVDTAGNDGTIKSQAYVLDTAAPSAPSTPDLSSGSDSGSSNSDDNTSTTTPSFSGTAEANATVTLYDTDGTTVLGSTTADGSGNWTITSSSLSDGVHTVSVKATDAAGNVSSASSGLSVTIDSTAPTTTVATLVFSADTGSSSSDFITKTAAQTISGTLSANVASGEIVQVSLDNGSTWATASTTVGQNTYSLAGQTLVASNTLKVKVVDTAGNDGTIYSQAYVLDTTAPTTTVSTVAFSADTGSSSSDFITKTAAQTISGTLSANVVSGEIVQVSLDNGSTWATASTTVGQNTYSLAGQTLSGSNTLKVKVLDTAGNDGTIKSQAYVLDTAAPSAPSTPDLSSGSDTGSSNSDDNTSTTTPSFSGTAEANATVTLYDTDGTTVLGSTTADGSGNWSITSSSLADGTHDVSVKATDAAGNVSSASSKLSVTIDTAAPTTTVSTVAFSSDTGSSSTDFITSVAKQDISGTLSTNLAANEIVQISTDNGSTWADATATVGQATYSLNKQTLSGSDTLKVRVVDKAGNIGTVKSQTYTIDTTAPAAPSTPDLDTASDSGPSSTDNYTNDDTPSFSGTGEVGATITLYDTDGSTPLGTTTVDGAGKWNVTSKQLSEGTHTVSVKAVDTAGNESSASSTLSVTIDTSAPSTSVSTVALSNDSGSSSSDFITNVKNQDISGTLSANLAANETVQVSLDNGSTWADATATIGKNSFSLTGQTLSGSNTLQVRLVDKAGNAASVKSQAYVLDQTASTTTVSTLSFSNDTGSSSTDFITKTAAQDIAGTLSANLATGEKVQVSLDNGSTWQDASASVGTNSFSLTGQTLSASNTLKVKVVDNAGNDGTLKSQAYTLDTSAPSTTVSTVAFSNDSGSSNTDFITNMTSQTISGTLSANLASDEVVQVSLDNGATWKDATATVGQTTFSLAGQTLSGSNTLQVRVSDLAGNNGSAKSQAYVLDQTAPTTSIASLALSNDNGVSNTDFITSSDTQVISGKLTANLAANETVQVSLNNGGTWFDASATVGQDSFSLASKTLNPSGTLKVWVVDLAGNVGSASSQAYIVDTTAPNLSSITLDKSSLKIGSSATVTFKFDEKVGNFDTSDITVGNGSLSNLSSGDGGKTWTATLTPTASVESASNVISVDKSTLTDIAGNAGSGTTNSANYKIDTKLPTATLTLDKTSLKQGDTSKLTVTFSEAVSGFTNADLTIANGTLSGVSSSDGGITYTATFTPTTQLDDSSNLITLDNTGIADAFGNAGSGSTDSNNYSIDTKGPGVTITLSDSDLRVGETATVTFSFGEAVSGFDNSDISLNNGTLSAVSSKDGGLTYTGTFTPTDKISAPTNTISVNLTGVSDALGNVGTGSSSSANFVIDTTNTAPSLSGSKAGQTTLDTGTVTPFANVTVTDPDIGASETISVKLDTATKGSFTAASLLATGFSTSDAGLTYTHAAGTPAAIQAALRGLVFQPATGRVAVGASETTTFTLSVNDGIAAAVNDSVTTVISTATNLAPTGINLSASQLDQSQATNTVVGNFSTSDPNPDDRFSYQLVAGNGSNDKDNALFSVVGNQLLALNPNTMPPGEYRIYVRSTDASGGSVMQGLSIQVSDSALPSVLGIYLSGAETVSRGQVSYIVRFNKLVTGVDASDFVLASTGSATGTIVSATAGNANTWVVTVNQISGDGTLGLNLKFGETGIIDRYNQNLINNGIVGQRYRIDPSYNETTPESDNDRDGVSRAVEMGVPNLNGNGRGDGNGDGLLDDIQNHVSSLVWQKDKAKDHYLTISNTQKLDQLNVQATELTGTAPAKVELNYGAVNLQTAGVAKDGQVEFTLFSDKVDTVNGIWLRTKTGEWQRVMATQTEENGHYKFSFKVKEGSKFDLGAGADGEIKLSVAPGFSMVPKAGDKDGDGIPDALEAANGTNPNVKDNAVLNRSDLFVKQLYRDVLYREADIAGQDYWQKQLDSGAMSREQIANSFMEQKEFQDIGNLARLYFGTFGRLPDRDGLAYWIGQQKNGMALKNIAGSFVASSEFQSKFGNLDNSQFIDQIYQSVLQRSADSAGKAFWLNTLNSGVSRGDVLMSFTESAEFKQASQAKVGLTLDFLGLIGDMPDTTTFNQLLSQNLTQAQIVAQLMESSDYWGRFI